MTLISSHTVDSEATRILDERSFHQLMRRTTLVLSLALGLPLLGLIGLVISLLDSSYWVDHSDRVVAQTNHVGRRLLMMQTNFRVYRLDGNEEFLKVYSEQHKEIALALKDLADLVIDNPTQSLRVKKLRVDTVTWMEFFDGELARVRGNPELLKDATFLKQGAPLFRALHNGVESVIGEEERLRKERDDILGRVIVGLFVMLGLFLLVGVPLLMWWMQKMLQRSSSAYQRTMQVAENRANELQVTLNSIGDAVLATDAYGRVNFLNPAAEAATGWTNEEATGRLLGDVFPIFNEETGDIVENPVERVLRENIVVGLANHTILRSKNGREIPIEDSAAPIRGEDGKVRGVILVFRDVSEKRDTERREVEGRSRMKFLNELGEATRQLFDTEAIMEVTTRLLGQHLQVSRCAYAEVDPTNGNFVIPLDYTHECASSAGSYQLSLFGPLAEAQMYGAQTLVIRDLDAEIPDGKGAEMFKAIGIQAIICCPLVKEGQLRGMMAVHQTRPRNWKDEEISLMEEIVERCWATIERERAEAISRSRAERFRVLSEVVRLQVWTAAANGELDYVNQECLKYYGLSSPQEMYGNAWVNFVHPDDKLLAQQQWMESLTTGESYEAEFRLRTIKGEYRWFIVRAEAMHDSAGKMIKWFGTNTDIQDLKMAQGKAEEASQKKDAFLATLSHELRTPLTPVLMTASALRNEERLPEDVRDQLAMIERNITLEARLIDDLLDLTSIAQGKLQLRKERCDAHSLISRAMEIVQNDARSKNIVVSYKCLAERSQIYVDPVRFQQVIWNLLRNSVKFTPSGGNISIQTLNENQDYLRIKVVDSGIGIEPDMWSQIFNPFEQGEITGDHRFGGMGLGLAIARAIVHAEGGTIRAESPGIGQGATFVLEIPVTHLAASEDKTALKIPVSALAEQKKKSLRLLLVEDHDSTLVVMSKLLAREGHQVVTANNATIALEKAADARFDLVISDLGLPDMSGVQLMEKLRDQYGLRGVALSGYGMEKDVARSLEAGFVRHIVKPVDFNQLREVLAQYS